MDNLIQFFTDIPSSTRSIILVSGLTFFFLLEAGLPLFRFKYNKVSHALLNLFFTLTTLLINLAGAFIIVKTADFNSANQFGAIHLISMPLWTRVVFGVILLDFIGAWFIHWLEHRVKWMWKFHIIHHTDTTIDVTSGLRHHPGESVFRLFFTIAAVGISGSSMGIVMLYQTISAFFAQLTHANIKMPVQIDKLLSWIFVTPHFHKIHHHYVLPHTDRNYGNIFSIWDHLFGTAIAVKSMDELTYGLDTHMKPEEHSDMKNLLLIPFQEYRTPEGSKFGV